MPPRRFDTTRWSLVVAAGRSDSGVAREALASLCQAYWYPLYAHVRRAGHSVEDAEDLTQGFLARFIEHAGFSAARRDRGRLRSYLLGSLNHFLSREAAARRALKRGGDAIVLPMEFEAGERQLQREPADEDTPDRVFERRWAAALLDGVLTAMRAEAEADGRTTEFDVLRPGLVGDARGEYGAWASRLGVSEGAARVALHRLRRRFRRRVREAIADTLEEPDRQAVDEELGYLMAVLRRRA